MSNARLGDRVSDIVARRIIEVKRQHTPELVKVAMAAQEAFFGLTGSEHKATTGGVWRNLAATGKLSGPMQDTAHFLAHGHGQWQTLLAGSATGAAMGAGIMAYLQNELAPATQALIAATPHGVLAPADLALAVSRGIMTYNTGLADSAKSGIGDTHFRRLVTLNAAMPTVADIVGLYQRGDIDVADLHSWLARLGVQSDYQNLAVAMQLQILTPDQLAALVTFGVLTQATAAKEAARSGMNATDFGYLVEGNGQPPSNEELLFAYRRGLIDKARLLRGITQGPVRNEWFDVIESLGQVPMSTADAIEAAVQNHLSYDQAKAISGQNGLMADQFDPLYQTAGSPPGPEAMMSYLNRGFITETQATQALAESRLKPKYYPLILKSREALLPMVQVRQALGKGAITHEHAVSVLAAHGYNAEDTAVILQDAVAVKTETARKLTESQVLALHTQRAITDAQATEMLGALEYTPDQISWLLSLTELQHMTAMVNVAINKIRSQYVGRHIDESTASGDLDALGVIPAQRDSLMTLWDIERSTVTKSLTLAQATKALGAGLLTSADFTNRVAAMGYAPADVSILVALSTPAAG